MQKGQAGLQIREVLFKPVSADSQEGKAALTQIGDNMTQIETKARELIAKWQPLLGLQNWRIEVQVREEKGETSMWIEWEDGYRKALTGINPLTTEAELEFRDDIFEANIIHELVHLLLAPVRDVLRHELNSQGNLYSQFQRAQETVIDEMTTVILRLGKPDIKAWLDTQWLRDNGYRIIEPTRTEVSFSEASE